MDAGLKRELEAKVYAGACAIVQARAANTSAVVSQKKRGILASGARGTQWHSAATIAASSK